MLDPQIFTPSCAMTCKCHPCLVAKHSLWAGIIFLKMCLSPPVATIGFFVFWKLPIRAPVFIKLDPVSLCIVSNMFM